MQIKKIYLGLVGAVTLITLIASSFWVKSLEEPHDLVFAFVSIGLDQQSLSTEVSSYEILRANEHFSDIVLGWTLEPSFAAELGEILGKSYSFTGQRQEKQNLIFTFRDAEDSDPALELVGLISSRLAQYNEVTHSAYKVALAKYSVTPASERSDLRIILGATLLAFLLSGLGIFFWDYATRR